jgi:DNA-binding SARP family transcriptional activator
MATHPAARLVAQTLLEDLPALHLFGGPYFLVRGRRLDVPEGSQRLVVFVALNGGQVDRRYAAGTLWPVGDDVRAAGNLRSALWRLRGAGIHILTADRSSLALTRGTVVDVAVVCDWALRLIEDRATTADLENLQWRPDLVHLLPGWYDEWVIFERERVRQRVLHGLESLVRRLMDAGRIAEAIEAAVAAVAVEPLRESAQRVLIEAHLAEGNVVEAWRSFEAYRLLVSRELGVAPGRRLVALVRGVGSVPGEVVGATSADARSSCDKRSTPMTIATALV